MYNNYGYETATVATGLAAFGIGMVFIWLISMAISIFTLVSMWKVFKKAGKPGWAAIIPIYNIIVMLEIGELPTWYVILYFIPFANIYAMFKTYIELAHKFGKTTGFGVGIAFLSPIFLGILAFSKDANYIGGQSVQQQMYQQPVQPQPMYQQPVMPQETVQPVNPAPAKFCPKCGNSVDANAKFCIKCGNQL